MERVHKTPTLTTALGVLAGVLTMAAATALAQSDFHRPLTLAPGEIGDGSGGGGDTPLPQGVRSGGSAPESGQSADEVAKQLANPNNPLASLTFKNQLRWYDGELPGAHDQFNYTLLFQPVFPFTLGESSGGGKANLFVRPAFPILVNQPVFDAANSRFTSASGLGDIGFDIGYGVTEKNGLLWAFGMVGTLPTATDSALAGEQLRLGPEMLLARFEKWGVYGIFPSHQWNVAGWGDQYFATTQVQPIFKVLPGGGWSIGTAPQIYYDWRAEQWTVPLNLVVSKTVVAGKTPIKVELEVNYYIERPDVFAPKWMVGINLTPVVPNIFDRWIHGK